MKILKKVTIGLAVLAVVLFGAYRFMIYNTKKASPEQMVQQSVHGADLSVFYCRPSKRGRKIFGELVPYGKVWRTGANEATTFESSKDLVIDGKTLQAGKYTLWTIPGESSWQVIFNAKMYDWGVAFGGVAARESAFDVLTVSAPVKKLSPPVEMFTIALTDSSTLDLSWDQTLVSVPFSVK